MSTAEHHEAALPLLRVGTGAGKRPGVVVLLAVRLAALLHVGLCHVELDRVVQDPVHDGVRVAHAAKPWMPVFFSCAAYRRRSMPCLGFISSNNIDLNSLSSLLNSLSSSTSSRMPPFLRRALTRSTAAPGSPARTPRGRAARLSTTSPSWHRRPTQTGGPNSAPFRVLRMQELERYVGAHELTTDAGPRRVGMDCPGIVPVGIDSA